MKKILIILLFISLGFHSIAKKIEVINKSTKFGNNYVTKKDISGTELILPDRIKDTYLETETNHITIQLRGLFLFGQLLKNNGDVILYDLTKRKTIWNKSINYQNYYLRQNGTTLFKTGLKKTYCLDFQSGDELWKSTNSIAFIHPESNIGIGYTPFIRDNLFNDNNFEGIDLKTGKTIWKRQIDHFYGLDDIIQINDNVAIIVATGLHLVNLKTGKGWDYCTETGEQFFQSVKTDIRSNVIIDSLSIYFASKVEISKLDMKGRIVWSSLLPEDLTSSSHILLMDSTLFMINTGAAQSGYWRVKQGKPFLAAYDIKDGRELFLNTIDDKSGKIIESRIGKKQISILYKDKIANCAVKDGTLITTKSIDNQMNGELVGFISNNIYIKYDSTYKSLAMRDTLNNYVYTTKNKILAIDEKLNIVNEYDVEQLYKYYLQYNKLKFLSNKYSTIIIDKNNLIVAKIDIAGKGQRIGSNLYFVKEKSIIEIDLNEISQME